MNLIKLSADFHTFWLRLSLCTLRSVVQTSEDKKGGGGHETSLEEEQGSFQGLQAPLIGKDQDPDAAA